MPEISVIIPTYNRVQYVTKAIDSVLVQTYTDYEIIVVDDGSTDNTKEVLEPYMGRIKYIYQENAGVSAARNAGIRAATGEWVAFLDSDDEWLPEKLAVQMDFVSENPEIVAHVTNAKILLPDNESVDLFTLRGCPRYGVDNPLIEKPLIDVVRYQFFTPSLLARRQILSNMGGFDVSMSIYEDGDMMRRLALEGPWGVSNRCLALAIRRDEPRVSLSYQHRDRPIYSRECMVRICSKLNFRDDLEPQERRLVRRNLSMSRFDLGVLQLEARNKRQAYFSLRQSFLDSPSVKSLVKYLLVRCLGKLGLWLVELKRSLGAKGFRRSDFGE